MGLTALCPGTFDPVTNGHLDIISRATRCFEHVVVAVLENPGKDPLFSVEERVAMLKEATAAADLDHVEVTSFSGLLVNYAKSRGAHVVVKGLRAVTDFDYELQMAQMNNRMAGMETFFVAASPQWSYLSSSLIKEVVRFGGDVTGLVPAVVQERLAEKFAPGKEYPTVDITARLQQIEELIQEAKSMPLSSSVLVSREELLELLEAARTELPEEVKQARWVVKDRDELLAKGRRDAEALVERGREERGRLISEQEVVRAAADEADRVLSDAREQARQIRLEAEDYVDAKLAQYEIALDKTRKDIERSMRQVQRGRDKLRGVSPAQEEFGGEEAMEEEA